MYLNKNFLKGLILSAVACLSLGTGEMNAAWSWSNKEEPLSKSDLKELKELQMRYQRYGAEPEALQEMYQEGTGQKPYKNKYKVYSNTEWQDGASREYTKKPKVEEYQSSKSSSGYNLEPVWYYGRPHYYYNYSYPYYYPYDQYYYSYSPYSYGYGYRPYRYSRYYW